MIPLLYHSTRGQTPPVPSARAIELGLAPDGGLFLPDEIPALSPGVLAGLCGLPYPELAARVISLYLTDYGLDELRGYTEAAYGPDRFDDPAVAPLVALDERTHVLELWHGPTAAFKDVALQFMPHLLTSAMARAAGGGEVAILVATSGDTGKAALEGFRDVPGTRIAVFYPKGGVSRAQELQMTTQAGANTAVVAVEGNFDDAQTGVKALFNDRALAGELASRGLRFSSANSINWGRLVPQIAYYVHAYAALVERGAVTLGRPVNICVPTGNFGNILAAYYARAMGVPAARLICASNVNKVLTDFIATGVYDRRRTFYRTVSPSMDILVSSNLERLLYLLADRDPARVRGWMAALAGTGSYDVGPEALRRLREVFWAGFASEEETSAAIGRVWRERGYLLDTHTAVGWHVLEEYRRATGDETPAILAATASPFKFGRAVLRAIAGDDATAGRDELDLIADLAERTGQSIPAGLRDLDKRPVRHRRWCKPEGMKDEVREILGI
ncbi:MAG: threonine synthase [Patescibacteria group bacterium]